MQTLFNLFFVTFCDFYRLSVHDSLNNLENESSRSVENISNSLNEDSSKNCDVLKNAATSQKRHASKNRDIVKKTIVTRNSVNSGDMLPKNSCTSPKNNVASAKSSRVSPSSAGNICYFFVIG